MYKAQSIDNFCQYFKSDNIGEMIFQCSFCSALKFEQESASICCNKGSVNLNPMKLPNELLEIIKKKKFKRNARAYNQAFAISTIGGIKQDNSVNNGGTQTYRVCGKAYHRYGSLNPKEGEPRQYAQIYFYDGRQQDRERKFIFKTLDEGILEEIRQYLESNNPYVQKFKQVKDNHQSEHYNLVFHHFDDKVYNAPTLPEIGAIQDATDKYPKLSIVMSSKADELRYVNDLSSIYDPVQYLLIHPHGEQGWHTNMAITCKRFYAFHAFTRPENKFSNPLILLGSLNQQYWVDMALKMERLRLNFVTHNPKFRGANVQQIQNAREQNKDLAGIKLPSSCTGSPRYMYEKFKDTVHTCEKFGGPHLFVTVTCNPKWIEIEEELVEGQSAFERPELLVRVFKIKLDRIIKDIMNGVVFGKATFHVHVIEFQKRMLPHAHIAIGLAKNEPLSEYNPEKIDEYIYAELPDRIKNPQLFEVITKHNLHYPCDQVRASCLDNSNICSKHFPKAICEETHRDEDGWVQYRRRNGVTFKKKYRGRWVTYTNQHVVPYNPYLSMKYNCHINVEYVNSIHPIKYLFTYFYKGPPMASASLKNPNDEVEKYLTGRYMTACEALWRILGFPLVYRNVPVMPLPVHLPERERIVFGDSVRPKDIQMNSETKLTEFFIFCRENNAKIVYDDITKYATWSIAKDKNGSVMKNRDGFIKRIWKKRERETNQLGRIQPVSTKCMETFCLRLLLKKVQGPKSFQQLKKYNGQRFDTYQRAAKERGLLKSDEIQIIFDEAKSYHGTTHLKNLMASLFMFTDCSNPQQFFEDNYEHVTRYNCKNDAAYELDQILKLHGRSIKDYIQNIEIIPYQQSNFITNSAIYNETIVYRNILNSFQQKAYDVILNSIRQSQNLPVHQITSKVFYIDAPAGFGKTFVLNSILGTCYDGNLSTKSQISDDQFSDYSFPVAAVSTTNQSAELLLGGSTAHRYFNIPLDLFEDTSCQIAINSEKARCIKNLQLLIIDEVGSAHRYLLEAIDRCLRDITNVNEYFGGKVVVLTGCFRQTLPIVQKGTRDQIIAATVTSSPLWQHVKTLRLIKNERCNDIYFAKYLMKLANGKKDKDETYVKLYPKIRCSKNQKKIIDRIYPEKEFNNQPINNLAHFYAKRILMAPRHYVCDEVNEEMIDRLIGLQHIYRSDDSVPQDRKKIPIDVLNKQNPPGIPPHVLKLKIGAPIILLRTINKSAGLVNGARGLIVAMKPNSIQIQLLTGTKKGTLQTLFRIRLNTDPKTGAIFSRTQFPIKLGFCITINKAQGLTIEHVGVLLNKEECFAHGQLYVALSRAKKPECIAVCLGPDHAKKRIAKNVVYRSVLDKG
jgi:PIF1-like helicase/Helitron helicase-like domain at N-terminus/Helicase